MNDAHGPHSDAACEQEKLSREIDAAIVAELEHFGERLKADLRASGVPWYVESDAQGQVVYRDVDTDEELAPEVIAQWRETR